MHLFNLVQQCLAGSIQLRRMLSAFGILHFDNNAVGSLSSASGWWRCTVLISLSCEGRLIVSLFFIIFKGMQDLDRLCALDVGGMEHKLHTRDSSSQGCNSYATRGPAWWDTYCQLPEPLICSPECWLQKGDWAVYWAKTGRGWLRKSVRINMEAPESGYKGQSPVE